MKRYRSIFAIVATLALITIACNAVTSVVPATPPGPQPGPMPQGPNPGQPPNPERPPNGPGPASPEGILIDQMVHIPGGGGSAEVAFEVANGQRVQILLSASDRAMQPYGSLQYPDGATVDSPPINTTANGGNQVDILLNQNGRYTLTLFDGSNRGGSISVKVVALK